MTRYGSIQELDIRTSKILRLIDNIPDELKERNQWVVHRKKIPYDPNTLKPASTTDSLTWGSFEQSIWCYDTEKVDGIGFVFSSGDPFIGVDLDRCRDKDSGQIRDWAIRVIQKLGGYAEVSPSGTGVHVILRGKFRRGGTKRTKEGMTMEVYTQERYFTVTGRVINV